MSPINQINTLFYKQSNVSKNSCKLIHIKIKTRRLTIRSDHRSDNNSFGLKLMLTTNMSIYDHRIWLVLGMLVKLISQRSISPFVSIGFDSTKKKKAWAKWKKIGEREYLLKLVKVCRRSFWLKRKRTEENERNREKEWEEEKKRDIQWRGMWCRPCIIGATISSLPWMTLFKEETDIK